MNVILVVAKYVPKFGLQYSAWKLQQFKYGSRSINFNKNKVSIYNFIPKIQTRQEIHVHRNAANSLPKHWHPHVKLSRRLLNFY